MVLWQHMRRRLAGGGGENLAYAQKLHTVEKALPDTFTLLKRIHTNIFGSQIRLSSMKVRIKLGLI